METPPSPPEHSIAAIPPPEYLQTAPNTAAIAAALAELDAIAAMSLPEYRHAATNTAMPPESTIPQLVDLVVELVALLFCIVLVFFVWTLILFIVQKATQ